MDETAFHNIVAAVLDGRDAVAERRLATVDGPFFRRWAEHHRLSSILFELSREGGTIRALVHDDRIRDAADDLARGAWIGRLLAALRDRGVTAVAFKGCGVAHLPVVYPRPELRPLGDLDLLVCRDDVRAATEAAESCGFRPVCTDPKALEYYAEQHYQLPLDHADHGRLELHHALYSVVPDEVTARMIERAIDVGLYGQQAKVLRAPDLLLVIAIHFAQQPLQLSWVWLVDILRLAASLSPEEWDSLFDETLSAGEQVFLWVSLSSLAKLWELSPQGMAADFLDRLAREMTPGELAAGKRALTLLPEGQIGGVASVGARAAAGRPLRQRHSLWDRVVVHPGLVCVELGVRSDSPLFLWHRIRHFGVRARRRLRRSLGR